jgi:hypothetical protein
VVHRIAHFKACFLMTKGVQVRILSFEKAAAAFPTFENTREVSLEPLNLSRPSPVQRMAPKSTTFISILSPMSTSLCYS